MYIISKIIINLCIYYYSVTILDAITYEPIREFKKTNVIDINFSPKGKFLALYTKFGNFDNNLLLLLLLFKRKHFQLIL